MWTIDELVERVREALAAEYSGASDGRVRDVPDRRAIRWYTTIGLVDRPLGMRGRTALYGPRHLRQLVAIKRQQAAGRSLSQIQAELAWVSDGALAELSRVPERLLKADGPDPDNPAGVRQLRFWAQSPAPGVWAVNPDRPAEPGADPARDIAASMTDTAPAPPDPAGSASTTVTARGKAARKPAPHKTTAPGSAVFGVALGAGAILLVPHAVSDDDRDEIVAAAGPLLDLLEARGLVEGRFA